MKYYDYSDRFMAFYYLLKLTDLFCRRVFIIDGRRQCRWVIYIMANICRCSVVLYDSVTFWNSQDDFDLKQLEKWIDTFEQI